MSDHPIINEILNAWRVHNEITLSLIAAIPSKGFSAVPLESRGRTVAEQLAHMNAIRLGWLHYHLTGKRPPSKLRRQNFRTRPQFRKGFRKSGKAVADFLGKAFHGETKTRAFNRSAVRWMCYLISHESHHRGSIMLALKQNGMRMKEDVAIQDVWGKWMWGKT